MSKVGDLDFHLKKYARKKIKISTAVIIFTEKLNILRSGYISAYIHRMLSIST